ncbi:MAG: HigA family addiction module antitoxin [Bryobacterales bacterium]|nr:HigA family addiction module antitoxin [Bryobacterales bacterium]
MDTVELYSVNGAIPAELLERLVERIRRNPSHPGSRLADSCERKGLSPRAAADRIGVDPAELDRVIAGSAPVTPDLAVRLEAAGWPSAESWMRRQSRYDLAQARRRMAA